MKQTTMEDNKKTPLRSLQYFTQKEYNRILDEYNATAKQFTQSQCESILSNRGASYEQAKNGAYKYLHNRNNIESSKKGSREEYDKLLDEFNASRKQPKECIRYLKSIGFSYGQANSAVYGYRKREGLIRK